MDHTAAQLEQVSTQDLHIELDTVAPSHAKPSSTLLPCSKRPDSL